MQFQRNQPSLALQIRVNNFIMANQRYNGNRNFDKGSDRESNQYAYGLEDYSNASWRENAYDNSGRHWGFGRGYPDTRNRWGHQGEPNFDDQRYRKGSVRESKNYGSLSGTVRGSHPERNYEGRRTNNHQNLVNRDQYRQDRTIRNERSRGYEDHNLNREDYNYDRENSFPMRRPRQHHHNPYNDYHQEYSGPRSYGKHQKTRNHNNYDNRDRGFSDFEDSYSSSRLEARNGRGTNRNESAGRNSFSYENRDRNNRERNY